MPDPFDKNRNRPDRNRQDDPESGSDESGGESRQRDETPRDPARKDRDMDIPRRKRQEQPGRSDRER